MLQTVAQHITISIVIKAIFIQYSSMMLSLQPTASSSNLVTPSSTMWPPANHWRVGSGFPDRAVHFSRRRSPSLTFFTQQLSIVKILMENQNLWLEELLIGHHLQMIQCLGILVLMLRYIEDLFAILD